MKRDLRLILLVGLLLSPTLARAETVTAAWAFDANDNTDVTHVSQTVSALGGAVTFDFNVTMTSDQGTVVDTSSTSGPITQPDGIGVGGGSNIEAGESITFALSIGNVQSTLAGDATFDGLTFRFLGTNAANGNTSAGTLTIDATDYSWQDANGPGSDFTGHVPGIYPSVGFRTDSSGQTFGAFNLHSGFDLPVTSGGAVTTFSHAATLGSYRLHGFIVEVDVTETVRAGWNFNTNDDSDLSTVSRTMTALDGAVSFDFVVSMTSGQGTVVDTSAIAGPSNQRRGIGVGAGTNVDTGESIDFAVSIENVVGDADFSNLTFRFIGVEAGNGRASRGRLTIDSMDYDWEDANGNGVTNNDANTGSDFTGHLPGVTHYTAGQGWIVVQSGFDLPVTSGGTVETFSHLTTGWSYRLNDLVVEVVVSPTD